MKRIFCYLFIALLFSCSAEIQKEISLAGEWQFQMDPNDVGEEQNWFYLDFSETVQLPGSMVENNKGYEITLDTEWTGGVRNADWYEHPSYAPYHDASNIRFPYWLQPDKKYTGAAWYRKTIMIPDNWEGKTVKLNLERPHWESLVWVNGAKLPIQNSLATPHVYNISDYLYVGENTLTIRIDNRTKDVDVGWNSHSISDHTQSNWNGIVGDISIEVADAVYFENVRIFPDVKTKSIEIKAEVNNSSLNKKDIEIEVETEHIQTQIETAEKFYEFSIPSGKSIVKMTYPMGEDAKLWDEFNPNVYELLLEMRYEDGEDVERVDFGLRDFKAGTNGLTINGRPVFLRGTLECAIFPLTGYPPCHAEDWAKVYKAVKDHGLNHVRFHSWCPPEAAFIAADTMGIYLQVECSSWANQSTKLGSGLPIDQYIYNESERIVTEYGNHPSFVMMAYGNEPGGPQHREFLVDFLKHWKQKDNRRIYTSAAGWPMLEENEFHNVPQQRIQGWGEGLRSIINSEAPKTNYDWSSRMPKDGYTVVSHEIGQWCVYPNFKEIEKYTGPLKAKNFEIFQESLSANHMGQLAEDFLMASGKLQALCYKADIEAALRTPNFGGFQLLDLHDFPGQGTALVGVLDPFWEEKGYISPEEYRRFCNTTVPLARLEKRIFKEGETMEAAIEVAHFGTEVLISNPVWTIKDEDKIVAEGTLGEQNIKIGNAQMLGDVIYTFPGVEKPRKLTLEVKLGEFSNSWDIWVYPESRINASANIKVVDQLSSSTMAYLEKGGSVLLSLGKGKVAKEMGGDIGVGFSSIFWNTAWTDGQKPHTLGILCDPQHPALSMFPTEYHSNWQWWDAMSHCDAINLNEFPVELKPIVRIIDDWVTNRRLALLFEAKVGKGKILVSGVDLIHTKDRLEAQQLKTSILQYMASKEFDPNIELNKTEIKSIMK